MATAASNATLTIYEQEGLFERAAAMSPRFLDAAYSVKDLPVVTDVRGYGMLAGIDLAPEGNPGQRGAKAVQPFYEAGLMVKITGDAVLLAPPLVCEDKHIDELQDKLHGVLKSL